MAFDVRLLVSELVTNSVQHASVGADDSIMLTVKISGELVRVEVRDGGPGFEQPEVELQPERDTGWGLFLVEQIADSWGVDRGERAVWFEIARPPAGSAEGDAEQSTAA